MKKLILSLIIASALFASCKKNDAVSPSGSVNKSIGAKNLALSTADVYVAGDYQLVPTYNDAIPQFAAAYWKNGNYVTLPSTPGFYTSLAQAVAVSGSDVYVVGYDHGTNIDHNTPTPSGIPCIWKNSVEQPLPIPSGSIGEATGIVISGTDIYVSGYYITNDATHTRRAMLWKNGVATMLAFNKFDSIATGIALDGTDVYVCGNAVFNGVMCAVYWKNNIWHPFAGTAVTSRASAITVDANHNYYISGAYNKLGCYWKDGNLVPLTGDDYQAPILPIDELWFPNNIAASTNMVYVSGVYRQPSSSDPENDRYPLYMAYWKNGQAIPFMGNIDAGGPTSIAIAGTDVFTAGSYDTGNGFIPYYSVNQQTAILQNPAPPTPPFGTSLLTLVVRGIFVVQH